VMTCTETGTPSSNRANGSTYWLTGPNHLPKRLGKGDYDEIWKLRGRANKLGILLCKDMPVALCRPDPAKAGASSAAVAQVKPPANAKQTAIANGSKRPSQSVPEGFYPPTDIAKAMNASDKRDAIRMALKRLFDENRLPGGAWMENNNPAWRQAKILYRLSLVRPFLARFEPSARD